MLNFVGRHGDERDDDDLDRVCDEEARSAHALVLTPAFGAVESKELLEILLDRYRIEYGADVLDLDPDWECNGDRQIDAALIRSALRAIEGSAS